MQHVTCDMDILRVHVHEVYILAVYTLAHGVQEIKNTLPRHAQIRAKNENEALPFNIHFWFSLKFIPNPNRPACLSRMNP